MRYISIDIETTGLDPQVNQIIEIAAIIEEPGVGQVGEPFHCFVNNSVMTWDVQALRMNWELMRLILDDQGTVPYLKPADISHAFWAWMNRWEVRKGFFAGKNVGSFDLLFLRELPGWKDSIRMYHRFLDVGPLYFDPTKHDVSPDLYSIATSVGIDIGMKHRAMDDAALVIKLLRNKYDFSSTQTM